MRNKNFTLKTAIKYPHLKILALSMFREKGIIREMLCAGVSCYILKNRGKQELKDAQPKVPDSGMFFNDEVSAEMTKSISEKKQLANVNQKANLTPREKEIIQLIAKEFSNRRIASTLLISERTVETHRKNIFRKTNIKSLVGLIKYAIENKLTN